MAYSNLEICSLTCKKKKQLIFEYAVTVVVVTFVFISCSFLLGRYAVVRTFCFFYIRFALVAGSIFSVELLIVTVITSNNSTLKMLSGTSSVCRRQKKSWTTAYQPGRREHKKISATTVTRSFLICLCIFIAIFRLLSTMKN